MVVDEKEIFGLNKCEMETLKFQGYKYALFRRDRGLTLTNGLTQNASGLIGSCVKLEPLVALVLGHLEVKFKRTLTVIWPATPSS